MSVADRLRQLNRSPLHVDEGLGFCRAAAPDRCRWNSVVKVIRARQPLLAASLSGITGLSALPWSLGVLSRLLEPLLVRRSG